jgi:hypothetical protein
MEHRECYRFYEFNIKKQTAFNWQYLIYKNNPFSYLKSLWSSLPKRLRAVLTLMAYSFITKYWTFVVISLFSWWEIWVVIYIWLVQYVYVIFNLAHDYCNIDLERVPWHKTCEMSYYCSWLIYIFKLYVVKCSMCLSLKIENIIAINTYVAKGRQTCVIVRLKLFLV